MSDGIDGEGRRLRPLAAALLIPVLALVVAGGFGLRARQAASGSAAANPPPRGGAAMAWDAAHGVVVMFGGHGTGGDLHDTWTWDGSAWTEQHPSTSPQIDQPAVMAADPASGRVLLFVGGEDGDARHSAPQTWSWDGTTWRREHPAHQPQGMAEGMAGDPATHQVVLVVAHLIPPPPAAAPSPAPSGVVAVPLTVPASPMFRQTWTWNGADWQLRETTRATGPFRGDSLAWDARGHRVVLLTVHPLCGATIENGPPPAAGSAGPPPPNAVAVPPPAPSPAGAPPPSFHSVPPVSPQPVEVGPFPPPVPGPAAAGGPVTGRLVPVVPCEQVAGAARRGASPSSVPGPSLSAWTGGAWRDATPRSGQPLPGGLLGSIVDDPSSGGLLLESEEDGWWSIAGGTATRQRGGDALPWRQTASLVGDPAHHVVLLFGGDVPGGVGADTWTWDGHTWRHRAGPLPVQPSPHIMEGAPPRHSVVTLPAAPP